MSYAYLGVGLVAGFLLGIGAALFYLRWKMKRQVGAMQSQMEEMMNMTDEMNEGLGGLEELEEKEEKEEED